MAYNFVCASTILHEVLLHKILSDWSTVDDGLVEVIEPIFQGIVKAGVAGGRQSSQMTNVVMEKYVYDAATKSITSCRSPFLVATAGAYHPHPHTTSLFLHAAC